MWETVTDQSIKAMSDTQTLKNSGAGETVSLWIKGSVVPVWLQHFIVLERLQDPGNLGTILQAGGGSGYYYWCDHGFPDWRTFIIKGDPFYHGPVFRVSICLCGRFESSLFAVKGSWSSPLCSPFKGSESTMIRKIIRKAPDSSHRQ